jgi:hypothetical protein
MGDDERSGVNCVEGFVCLDLPIRAEIARVRGMKLCRLLFLGLMAFVQSADAIVTISGATNNTAPDGQPFFNNIGSVGAASAIYLGNGWILSANHVASSLPATANFGGVNYTTQAGSFHRLGNPAHTPTLSSQTDIVLFRLAAPLALPDVSISMATPTVSSPVMMIGNGRIQESSRTYWDRTVNTGDNNDTWVETTEALSDISGFETTATREVRWGVNAVATNGFTANIGQGDVISYMTQFNSGAYTHEGQAVTGDSGGGVFSLNGTSWELSGMMYAVNSYENQPGGPNTAVLGVSTYIADLSAYRAEILTIIPEPSTAVLALAGMLVLARRRR